jgi:hypothetical protein
MTSVTLPRRAHNLDSIREQQNNHSLNIDDEEPSNYHFCKQSSRISTPARTSSYEESGTPQSLSSSTSSNNRFQKICSRLKHRFSLKERRTRSEDETGRMSERRSFRFKNYKSFSTTNDPPVNEFDWPDFEKVYDSIPHCLINALPGLDDCSVEESNYSPSEVMKFQTDESDEHSIQQMNLFKECKRGKDFRRNGICQKVDKIQYNSQLDTFIQQLMIEKLIRTWT